MAQTNLTIEKQPPSDIAVEMAALGSVMLDREALDSAISELTFESFYHLPHQTVFETVVKLYNQNSPVDHITVTSELRTVGKLESIGGAVYIAQLLDSVSTTANIGHYIKIISDKDMARNLIATASDVIKQTYEQQEEIDALLDQIETQVFQLSNKRVGKSFSPIGPLVHTVVDHIEKLYDDKNYLTGLRTNFTDIDELTSGLQRSDLIILAARPSMGKTALALNIIENLALEQKIPVALFSLEMSSEQLVQRMLCTVSQVDAQAVRKGIFEKKKWENITRAASELSTAPIFINDTPGINALQVRAIARRLKSAYDIQFIVVDYLQLMQGARGRYDNRQQEISEISRSLKALARELDIPVLVLSQLNREVENRPGREPQLSDLRESGAIEQDADVVMLLVRQEFYDPNNKPGLADLIVAKQRNGPTGKIQLAFAKEITAFRNYSHEIEPERAYDYEDGFEPG
jgi:replicative DNA helicase